MHLYKILSKLVRGQTRIQNLFWLSLSLTISLMFGIFSLQEAFRRKYVIQDDAQQHVFWLWQFVDSELFANDLIADYYQSVAQPGYAFFYKFAAFLGIEPIFLSRILPPILGIIATVYCFGTVIQIFPVPAAGFIATVIFNQSVWLKDDLASGTARAFLYPLFFAFLYYLLRRSLWPMLVVLLLLGLIYPVPLLICAGILIVRLVHWRGIKPYFSRERKDYFLCGAGLAVIFVILLPLLLQSSEYGSTITADAAREMIEFSEEGRTRFFLNDPVEYWLYAGRSGFFPVEWSDLPYAYFPLLMVVGLSLPLLMGYPRFFPLAKEVNSNVLIFPQLIAVSAFLFFAAHALLFKLYLPSRYTQYSLRIFTALAAGIALTIIWDALLQACTTQLKSNLTTNLSVSIIFLFCFTSLLAGYPAILQVKDFDMGSKLAYKSGWPTELYDFLRESPKDTLVASISYHASRLPALGKRPVLVSKEHSIPYHLEYYDQIRERATDLVQAQYSTDVEEVASFIDKYGVDLWLINPEYLFTPYGDKIEEDISELDTLDVWIRQFPGATEAHERWEEGVEPAMVELAERCTILKDKQFLLLDAECIQEVAAD